MLSRAFLASFLPLDALAQSQRHEIIVGTSSFVLREISLAPLHLRGPLFIFLAMFNIWVLCFSWRLSAAGAAAMWERLGGGPARNFVRLLRSLALLYVAEHPLILEQTSAPTVLQRQSHFRRLRGEADAA